MDEKTEPGKAPSHDTLPTVPTAPPEVAKRPPDITRRFGRYEIEGELGRGGMGVVLRALDRELRRHVAMKIVHREFAKDEDVVARFVAEAQVTAQLQHPAIVPVHDVGRTPEGELFYTMRLVQGRTLAKLVEERWASPRAAADPLHPGVGRWTFLRVLNAFVQVCRAVAYAHERGVVHRDLKPQNIMMGAFGEVHVMDWGLAKLRQSAAAAASPSPEQASPSHAAREAPIDLAARTGTLLDSVLGTPGYMAPEQASAPDAAGPLADVYSLGAILYSILTGRAPHRGSVVEILAKLSRGTAPVPPREVDPGVARELEEIALRALASEPPARHASAEALAEAVEGYIEGRPSRPSRPEDAEFLRSFRAEELRRPSVAVDVVLLAAPPGKPAKVFLLRRSHPPFQGCWALPGEFVRMEESLEAAARRTLHDETGIREEPPLEQVATFGDPGRDPRMRVITTAFAAVLRSDPPATAPSDEATEAGWFEVDPASGAPRGEPSPELAFDHARILAAAVARLARSSG